MLTKSISRRSSRLVQRSLKLTGRPLRRGLSLQGSSSLAAMLLASGYEESFPFLFAFSQFLSDTLSRSEAAQSSSLFRSFQLFNLFKSIDFVIFYFLTHRAQHFASTFYFDLSNFRSIFHC
jgi:hypothetical protein